MNEKISAEELYIAERRDESISYLEEYFPNGGLDHEKVVELFEALIHGKIPLLGLNY